MNGLDSKTRYFRIGIFVIVCLAAIAAAFSLTGIVTAQQAESDKLMSEVLDDDGIGKIEVTDDRSDLLSIFQRNDDAGGKSQIHPFVKDQANCSKCHDIRQMPGGASYIAFEDNSGAIQTVNCKGCHPQHLGDHPVLVRPLFSVPKDIPLSKRGEVTCMTCHNTHYERYSDRPWEPRSVKTRVLDYVFKKKVYKTYFLRRNNSKKELCISCHAGVRYQRAF